MQTISVTQLCELQRNSKIDLIDVRMPTEFREVHAECARSLPLDSLDPKAIMANRNGTADQPLYVICRSGNRSSQACKKFIEAGFENVVNVEGGTMAWEKAGLPVIRGKKSMPLMQQGRSQPDFLSSGNCVGNLGPSIRLWPVCLCGSRADVCRILRALSDGFVDCENAVEQV